MPLLSNSIFANLALNLGERFSMVAMHARIEVFGEWWAQELESCTVCSGT